MSLGQPWGLLWLAAIVPLAAAWWASGHARRRWDRRAGAAAVPGPGGRRRRVEAGLLLAAVVAAAVGLAEPRWGTRAAPLERRGIDLVIALDISRSMEAADVAPSRAAAAGAGVEALLAGLRGDRAGLVTFGGSAFRRSPLTQDLSALGQLVQGAQAERALVGPGTDIGAALRAALDTLAVPDAAETRAVVLISDGEDLGDAAAAAAADAAAAGVRVYTVAVGTEGGAPLPPGAPVADAETERGEAALSRADRAALAAIARPTGGDLRELDALPGLAVEFGRLRQSEIDRASRTVPVERAGWWFAAAAVLAAVAAVGLGPGGPRAAAAGTDPPPDLVPPDPVPTAPVPTAGRRAGLRGVVVALLVLGAGSAGGAGCAGDAVHRETAAGNDAVARGAYTEALRHYDAARSATGDAETAARLDYNTAYALHALGRYADAQASAARALERAGDPTLERDALYALGAHEFARGNLPAARDAYIGVLLRDPGAQQAKHNLELVLRALAPAAPPPPAAPGAGEGPGDAPPGPPRPDDTPPAADAPGTADGASGTDGGAPGAGGGDGTGGGADGPGGAGGSGGAAGDGGVPGGGPAVGDPRTAAEAEAALAEALAAFAGRTPTAEEARAILDLLRLSGGLRGVPPASGGPGDR